MLTINFDRLKLEEEHMVLDLGCGFGRHAFEVLRRGADGVSERTRGLRRGARQATGLACHRGRGQ